MQDGLPKLDHRTRGVWRLARGKGGGHADAPLPILGSQERRRPERSTKPKEFIPLRIDVNCNMGLVPCGLFEFRYCLVVLNLGLLEAIGAW